MSHLRVSGDTDRCATCEGEWLYREDVQPNGHSCGNSLPCASGCGGTPWAKHTAECPTARIAQALGDALLHPSVVGVDLSLTATGLSDGTTVEVVKTKPAAGVLATATRLRTIEQAVVGYAKKADAELVVVEGPSYGSKGSGTWDRGGLWWLTVMGLIDAGFDVAVCPPSSLKKYATGSGAADKGAMADAAARRLPDVVTAGQADAVDALWLAAAGRQLLGRPLVEMPKPNLLALDKVVRGTPL